MDVKEKIQNLKDKLFPRKLGYVNIPFTEEETKLYGHNQAYMPLKYAAKFGLEDSRELDTLDFAEQAIKMHNKEQPKFDGIIFDPNLALVSDIEKAMDYMAKKYKLPVSAAINGRFIVKSAQQQGMSHSAMRE